MKSRQLASTEALLLHDRAARLLGLTVTRKDRLALSAYAATLRGAGHLAPRAVRCLPVAR
ncbi:hypothetical protein [Nocardia sp. NPDC003979]